MGYGHDRPNCWPPTMFTSQRRIIALTLIAATLLAATGAEAQRTNRQRAPKPAPQIRYAPGPMRGSANYSVPPGYKGIITSSTPNESGNLGGPGAGGGGGGGP